MNGVILMAILVGMTIAGFEVSAPGIIINAIFLYEEIMFYASLPDDINAAIAALP